LQADAVQACDRLQDLLAPPHQLERALRAVLVLVGMKVREAGQRYEPLVDPRVVLHRAGAEWIEAGVDPEVASRELGEVAEDLRLRELRQPRRLGAAQLLGNVCRREVVARRLAAAATGLRLLEDQLHANTRASRS